ncbi:MAG: STAS domain-containing protein [Planctomycetales bacterium]|nr:STAS domain-containing protein [Planctomycetales bacterium]
MTVTVEAGTGEAPTRVRVAGEVDMNTAPKLRQTLRLVLEADSRPVVVHLGAVTYMDSAGIAVLIEGLQWSRRRGISYALEALPGPVRVVVELAKLDTVFKILPGDGAKA